MVGPAIVWTGEQFVVAYSELETMEIAFLNAEGSAVERAVRISDAGGTAPSLVWTGTELAVAWSSLRSPLQVLFRRLSSDGDAVTDEIVLDDVEALGVDLRWTGSELGVSYQAAGQGTYLVRIDDAGAWMSPPGEVDDDERLDAATSLAKTSTAYGVAYTAGTPASGRIAFRLAGCR